MSRLQRRIVNRTAGYLRRCGETPYASHAVARCLALLAADRSVRMAGETAWQYSERMIKGGDLGG